MIFSQALIHLSTDGSCKTLHYFIMANNTNYNGQQQGQQHHNDVDAIEATLKKVKIDDGFQVKNIKSKKGKQKMDKEKVTTDFVKAQRNCNRAPPPQTHQEYNNGNTKYGMIPSHGKAIRMTRVAKGKGNCGPNNEYIKSKQGKNGTDCVYYNHFDVGNYEWGHVANDEGIKMENNNNADYND